MASPPKTCIPQTDKLEGKTIVTVEGLTDWEKQVYTFAFGEAEEPCSLASASRRLRDLRQGLLDVN